jgi:hypothetical protein
MAADVHIVSGVIVAIRSFHVDVARLFAVDSGWRIGLKKVRHRDARPMNYPLHPSMHLN